MIAEQKSTEKVTRAPVSMVVMDDATRDRFWSKVSKGGGR